VGGAIFLSFVLWAAAFFTDKPEAKSNPIVIDSAGDSDR
jgi:hypothetical protein